MKLDQLLMKSISITVIANCSRERIMIYILLTFFEKINQI